MRKSTVNRPFLIAMSGHSFEIALFVSVNFRKITFPKMGIYLQQAIFKGCCRVGSSSVHAKFGSYVHADWWRDFVDLDRMYTRIGHVSWKGMHFQCPETFGNRSYVHAEPSPKGLLEFSLTAFSWQAQHFEHISCTLRGWRSTWSIPSFDLSIYLTIYISIYLSIYLLSINLSIHLFVHESIFPFMYLPLCRPIYLASCLFLY